MDILHRWVPRAVPEDRPRDHKAVARKPCMAGWSCRYNTLPRGPDTERCLCDIQVVVRGIRGRRLDSNAGDCHVRDLVCRRLGKYLLTAEESYIEDRSTGL